MERQKRDGARELVAYVAKRFERYSEGRRPFEKRWEEAYYNTIGEYPPGMQGRLRKGEAAGSKVFVRLTRQRVREASRRIEPVLRSVKFDLVSLDGGDRNGLAQMKEEIKRILAMAKVGDHLASMAWDAAWSGTGIVRVPVLAESASVAYGVDPASGLWSSVPVREDHPGVETVPIWCFYPDPDAPSIEEGEGVIQMHRLYSHQLRRLGARAGFDPAALERLIERGGADHEEDWERSLKSAVGRDSLGGSDKSALLEYWGTVPTPLLVNAGVDVGPDPEMDTEAVVIIGGGELLKAAPNPWQPAFRPYLRFRWEVVPHQFWGVGVAENIRDSQRMVNGATRLLLDNKALAGNCMFEVDVEALVPGQDVSSVYPGKKWVLRPGAKGPAIRPVVIPDVSGVLLEMIQLFENYADAASGVTPGPDARSAALGTATGMSIAMSAAGEGFRAIVRRIDDEVVEPLIERIYRWLMEYGDCDGVKGPARVRAVSTAATQAKEIRSKRLLDFLALMTGKLGNIPVGDDLDPKTLAGRIDMERLLDELAESLDVRDLLKEVTACQEGDVE